MTASWWAAHPDVRDVVDAADALVLAACARDIGHTAVEVPRYEVRERVSDAARSVLYRVQDEVFARSSGWPCERVTPSDTRVARVTNPDGHKRTAVVVVLRRGRTERAIVVDTEAP